MNSRKTRCTNFAGSWDDICPHCGLAQEAHRRELGEFDGEILEHRMPCEPERETLRRSAVARVRAVNAIVLVFWILVPLVILILEFTSPIVGAFAFGLSLVKLGIECVRFFGNPDKWIPGHKTKAEKQRRIDHYVYHCEKNPKGFAKLLAENLEQDEA